jgi:hypothetical protein
MQIDPTSIPVARAFTIDYQQVKPNFKDRCVVGTTPF